MVAYLRLAVLGSLGLLDLKVVRKGQFALELVLMADLQLV